MGQQETATEKVNITEAGRRLGELVNRISHQQARVIIEKDGTPVAALISAEDLERFTQWERRRAEQFKALDASWAAFNDLPDEEIEREVTKALAEVRTEHDRRRERQANIA